MEKFTTEEILQGQSKLIAEQQLLIKELQEAKKYDEIAIGHLCEKIEDLEIKAFEIAYADDLNRIDREVDDALFEQRMGDDL
tara:strand:- start:239 stop:484 length:246 start_codon:yes stop_codon:yes gene_type:complete